MQTNALKILVIEDNYSDFLLLKENIHLAKIAVTEINLAETLQAGIREMVHNRPDLVFLDLHLPDGTGLDSFMQLREHITSSAVVILSGMSDTTTAIEAISLGAQDYLGKGEFDEKLLARTIRYSIERKRNVEILREANERYSLVTKATHDLIWDWNLLTGEVYSDGTASETIHGAKMAMHDIENWNRRIHPDDADRWFKAVEKIKKSKDDFFDFEYRVIDIHGNYRHIYDRGYVVRDCDGTALRMIGAAQDITEKIKLETALRESQLQRQRAITEATIKGQENERQQLGIELHDNINQILATSRLYLEHALSKQPVNEEIVEKSKEFITLAIEEIRRLSKKLLPPTLEDFGLLGALCELIDTIVVTDKFEVVKEWDGFDEHVLQKDQKLTVYRILQEQLNNIIKHADAKHVTVSLQLLEEGDTRSVELRIKDDGNGFNPTKKRNGVGLRNIISRAELFGGTVVIQSEPNKGCELRVIFPGDHTD